MSSLLIATLLQPPLYPFLADIGRQTTSGEDGYYEICSNFNNIRWVALPASGKRQDINMTVSSQQV